MFPIEYQRYTDRRRLTLSRLSRVEEVSSTILNFFIAKLRPVKRVIPRPWGFLPVIVYDHRKWVSRAIV